MMSSVKEDHVACYC